jgi:hypothetical protein
MHQCNNASKRKIEGGKRRRKVTENVKGNAGN